MNIQDSLPDIENLTKRIFRKFAFVFVALAIFSSFAFAQKATLPAQAPKPIIFAVLNDGSSLEPIALVNKGKLEQTVNGSDNNNLLTAFNKNYYKAGTVYRLIFGGSNSGSVAVKSSDPKSDCSKNIATVSTKPAKTLLRGFVMGLATNAAVKSTTHYRRRPTTAEKAEIELLVRAEYGKRKLTPEVLHYHNLTALDFDSDGTAEMVGSYWIEVDKLTRALLFFIAGKDDKGKYSIGFDDYRVIDQPSVMSGEIKDVDDGVYHEMLLDVFDYDGDGSSEIFTYVRSFEGSGFNVYRRKGTKWAKDFEAANYHCAF